MRKILFAVILGALTLMAAPFAHANSDIIRNWSGTYTVNADGTVDVTTQLDWDFGQTGRRGIIHKLVIQEPWEHDGAKDAKYEITDVNVSSPTGAPAGFTQETEREGEFSLLSIRIGDPDITLDQPRHTYLITYKLTGAMRTFDDLPELFWDINSKDDVPIEKFTFTITGPGGVQKARCLVGPAECDAAVQDGVATLTGASVNGQIVSVVANFPQGSVANAEPHLVEAQDEDFDADNLVIVLIGIIVVVFGLNIVSSSARRRAANRRAHQHWAGVAPGIMNPGGPVETTNKPIESKAVRFTPPEAELDEAGLALDLEYKPSHLSALLVQMAVDGALSISNKPLIIQRADPNRVRNPLAGRLYSYASQTPTKFSRERAHDMSLAARYASLPSPDGILDRVAIEPNRKRALASRIAWILFYVIATSPWWFPPSRALVHSWLGDWDSLTSMVLSVWGTLLLGLLLMQLLSFRGNRARLSPPSLTPRGSAIRAQAQGFREYIATAEAHQLNFEADRDIYRRYLPWAVLFGLTKRWEAIGAQLVATGRLQAHEVTVYGLGSLNEINRVVSAIERQMDRADAAARRSSGSYGGGSGGSSGFDSSSSGGDGGGGSSSSSW